MKERERGSKRGREEGRNERKKERRKERREREKEMISSDKKKNRGMIDSWHLLPMDQRFLVSDSSSHYLLWLASRK